GGTGLSGTGAPDTARRGRSAQTVRRASAAARSGRPSARTSGARIYDWKDRADGRIIALTRGWPRIPSCLYTVPKMTTAREARNIARHWVRAWNSHHLSDTLSPYAEAVVLVPPVAA